VFCHSVIVVGDVHYGRQAKLPTNSLDPVTTIRIVAPLSRTFSLLANEDGMPAEPFPPERQAPIEKGSRQKQVCYSE